MVPTKYKPRRKSTNILPIVFKYPGVLQIGNQSSCRRGCQRTIKAAQQTDAHRIAAGTLMSAKPIAVSKARRAASFLPARFSFCPFPAARRTPLCSRRKTTCTISTRERKRAVGTGRRSLSSRPPRLNPRRSRNDSNTPAVFYLPFYMHVTEKKACANTHNPTLTHVHVLELWEMNGIISCLQTESHSLCLWERVYLCVCL